MRFRHDPGQSIRRFLPVVRFLTLAAALVVPAAIAIPVATGIAAPAAGDLATVQQYLGSVDTMTAQFTQTDRAGKVLTGTLSLKRSEKHTSELQSLMRISYAVFCLKKKKITQDIHKDDNNT